MRHSYAWSGRVPCTGVYRCVHCGLRTKAHPLDYSSVDYTEKCPALNKEKRHEDMQGSGSESQDDHPGR